ncbi:hypothetical protein LAZ67_21001110 [Cordylochernes scorpioides]|uniref:Uncharacterized protein n=1 Tax=Cordylochernes scorpioides TaxID=51811 RepID=A0ABY6LLR3_9ARAC|nr:hypothetical protein LAZ67_21001110 [Cordylochernes scorpioides]
MLFNAIHSVIYRLQAVIENEGCHIEQGLGNVETKRAYPVDNEVKRRPDKRRQTSDDVRAYPANMRSTVASTRRQTSGDVTLEHIKRACPAAKVVSQFSGCKTAAADRSLARYSLMFIEIVVILRHVIVLLEPWRRTLGLGNSGADSLPVM